MPPAPSFLDALKAYADALHEAYRRLPPGAQEEAQLGTLVANFLGEASAEYRRRPARSSGKAYAMAVSAEDLFAYAYALLANPAYIERFSEELAEPGPHLPLTRDPELFHRSVELGRRLVALHTFGERWAPEEWRGRVPEGSARSKKPIPGAPDGYPEGFRYDGESRRLHVGEGAIEPVAREVWEFSVSGLDVVKSWLAYRMKEGAGRVSSKLDEIRPERWTAEMTRELLELLWVLEATVAILPDLEANLDTVVAGPLFKSTDLPPPPPDQRRSPRTGGGKEADQQADLLDSGQ